MQLKSIFYLSLLFISSIGFSQNGQKNFIDQPYIEVTGQVETEITPDEIYLGISLNERDKRGKISIEEQENKMLYKLKALGINIETQLSILDFDGYYQRKFLAEDKMTKIKNYQLIINDGETLAKVYQQLDEIDISNISINRVSHSNIEKFKRDTKIKAIKVAKEKASEYAVALNQTIGKAIYVKEIQPNNYGSNSSNNVIIRGYSSLYGNRAVQQKFENLTINKITLTEKVLVKFILN